MSLLRICYVLFRWYVRQIHDRLYYKEFVVVGKDRVPAEGVPLIIASNHENCMMDALAVLFAAGREAKFLVRADIFENPKLNKLLRGLGLMPAYRVKQDGVDKMAKNAETWLAGEEDLLSGRAIVIFPEGVHQGRHTLGEFSYGYVKMAFEAAAKSGYKEHVYIQPAANHYESYSEIRSRVVIKFGEPLDIYPYYELYKEKPRTAQRRVNAIVRSRVEAMMLDVKDKENYEAIDYIRRIYGRRYAERKEMSVDRIEDRMESDRALVGKLEDWSRLGKESSKDIYEQVLRLKTEEKKKGIVDVEIGPEGCNFLNFGELLYQMALLPLFIFSLIPNIFVYLTPNLIIPKLNDKMFTSSVRFGVGILAIPILYMLTFVVDILCLGNWLYAMIHVMALPVLGIFSWYYWKRLVRLKTEVAWRRAVKVPGEVDVVRLRDELCNRLDEIVL